MGSKGKRDDRFWAPTRDKAGNGFALIRFLPAPEGNDVPWTRYFSYGFKGPLGKWYIENSRKSIDMSEADPVAEYASELWSTGLDSDKDKARALNKRTNYVANVYVIKDSGDPSNEGKVFLYRFGKKIFDKIMDALEPPPVAEGDDEVVPIDPFNLWEGANFKLRVSTVDKFPNYDKSEFGKSEPLFESDAALEEVYAQAYDLRTFNDPANFKSYDELKKHFERVMNFGGQPARTRDADPVKEEEKPRSRREEEPRSRPSTPPEDEEEEEDYMAVFKKLAEED